MKKALKNAGKGDRAESFPITTDGKKHWTVMSVRIIRVFLTGKEGRGKTEAGEVQSVISAKVKCRTFARSAGAISIW